MLFYDRDSGKQGPGPTLQLLTLHQTRNLANTSGCLFSFHGFVAYAGIMLRGDHNLLTTRVQGPIAVLELLYQLQTGLRLWVRDPCLTNAVTMAGHASIPVKMQVKQTATDKTQYT